MPLLVVLLFVVQLIGPWHSDSVYAQDSAPALSTSAEEGMADFNSVTVPDLALLQRLSPIFRNLEKNLILEHTRGQKEQRIFREAAPAVVMVVTNDGMGSGIVIDGAGYVLTNHHVVASYSTVAIIFRPQNGEELIKNLAWKATVEKIDEIADLALLKIENPPPTLQILKLGNSKALEVGMNVHSIGHPYGENWTYTQGTISALRKNYETEFDGKTFRANIVQHQSPTDPGNSGGPLLNDSGQVVGITQQAAI